VTRLQVGQPFDFQEGQELFSFAAASRPVLGRTPLPIQWLSGASSPGDKAAEA